MWPERVVHQYFGEEEFVKDTPLLYQSQRTNFVIEDVFINNNCKLPTYELSMSLHLLILDIFMKHFQSLQTEKVVSCPIT